MLFSVRHRSCYGYSREVFVEPQTIRLRPRHDPGQRLLDFSMTITPTPDGGSEYLDAEGNQAATIWFNRLIDQFVIETRFRVETLRSNPFDYLISEPGCESLPAAYPPGLLPALQSCLVRPDGDKLRGFTEELREAAGDQTHDFLNRLCDRIYREFSFTSRHRGAAFTAEQTLISRSGSCRDLAVLFIHACRQVGLAARFVSGYQEGDPDQDERQLHAWSEVYLPGGGWRGYDPTHGLAVSDRHIAVAASHHSSGAAPVSGGFRGTGVESRFAFELELATN